MKDLYYDVVIAGCGVAGLYTAIHLPPDKKVLLLSKDSLETCDSMLAQGGICVLRDDDDYDSYFEDTMRAGHYENRRESVDIMIRGKPRRHQSSDRPRRSLRHQSGRLSSIYKGGRALPAPHLLP